MSIRKSLVAPAFAFVFILTSCAPSPQQTSVPADSIYSGLSEDEEDGTLDAEIDLNAPVSDLADDSDSAPEGMSGITGGSGPRTGYLLMRASGHEIVSQQDAQRPRTMASVTKLATSLAALRNVSGLKVSAVADMLRSSNNYAASMLLRKFAKAVAGLDLPAPRVKNPIAARKIVRPMLRRSPGLNWLEKRFAVIGMGRSSLTAAVVVSRINSAPSNSCIF